MISLAGMRRSFVISSIIKSWVVCKGASVSAAACWMVEIVLGTTFVLWRRQAHAPPPLTQLLLLRTKDVPGFLNGGGGSLISAAPFDFLLKYELGHLVPTLIQTLWSVMSSSESPVKLTFSSHCFRNTTLDNSILKIRYRVESKESIFKSSSITRLYRWDAKGEKEVLVAEWEKNWFKSDQYRITRSSTGEHDFTPLKEILPNTWGFACSAILWVTDDTSICKRVSRPSITNSNRSFKGPRPYKEESGQQFTWRTRPCSLKVILSLSRLLATSIDWYEICFSALQGWWTCWRKGAAGGRIPQTPLHHQTSTSMSRVALWHQSPGLNNSWYDSP